MEDRKMKAKCLHYSLKLHFMCIHVCECVCVCVSHYHGLASLHILVVSYYNELQGTNSPCSSFPCATKWENFKPISVMFKATQVKALHQSTGKNLCVLSYIEKKSKQKYNVHSYRDSLEQNFPSCFCTCGVELGFLAAAICHPPSLPE